MRKNSYMCVMILDAIQIKRNFVLFMFDVLALEWDYKIEINAKDLLRELKQNHDFSFSSLSVLLTKNTCFLSGRFWCTNYVNK